MTVRPDEVASIIKREIEKYEDKLKMESVGTVLQVGDGVARIYGLDDCMSNELIEFPGGVYGIALNLEEDNVGCVLLGPDSGIKEGDMVKTTGRIVEVPVGEALLGRVVNALGQPLDGKGPIPARATLPIETRAPGVVDRQPVSEPVQTGLKIVDALSPLGRGQREEAPPRRPNRRWAGALRSDGIHHDRQRQRQRARPPAVPRPLCRLRHG